MPNTKSAKKALRVSLRKREINLKKKNKISQTRRSLNKTLNSDSLNKDVVIEGLSKYYSALDKAVKTNLIHKNKASRLKSRMAAKIKKVKEASN